MSTQPPAIPPRPSRSPQQQQQQGQTPPPTSTPDIPKIPPRPNRRPERSMSPLRHNYAPSPLNEKPSSLTASRTTSTDQLERPPSVTIPSLGQEGIEYDDLNVANAADSGNQAPAETRNVGSDLKLHAPRPSLPSSSANAQVAAVTRTDSRLAAESGIGRADSSHTEESQERTGRSLHSGPVDHQSLQSEEEHGIPEIGQRVPINPDAGDVQAPYVDDEPQHSGRTSQSRTRHNRDTSLPPGSYGLHGHGVSPNDKFEKAWYEKHPDEYAKEEQGQHGPAVSTPRPESALSSDALNKIVRGSATTGSGMGTATNVVGTPEEEVAYIASDEYTHRIASPAFERSTHPVVESPLRKMSHPAAETEGKQENKTEDPGVIHVDDPYHSSQHPDGFAHIPPPEEKPHQPGEGGNDEEEPILAADETRPESAFQHPAVPPPLERGDSFDPDTKSQSSSTSRSQPPSLPARPSLARYTSRGEERGDANTPLEDVQEYEPLFPEDENKEKETLNTAERFKKQPDTLQHKFPSKDVWEDTPDSLQLHTTVTTPEVRKDETSETPEEDSFRRSQAASADPHEVATNVLESNEKQEVRPNLSKQRFPSKDIWEDAPDSQRLVTTVGTPQEEPETKSPEVPPKPSIPSRPQKRPQEAPTVDTSRKPSIDASNKPAISPEKRQPPSIPDRPKPQVPSRPIRRTTDESKEAAEGQKEQREAPPVKPKPPVPSRPGGSKIAALKAGFLTDLNSRLQVGPQGPKPPEKKEEPPAEKKPLQDARKGRARGPARRKPAPAPTPAPAAATETAGAKPAAVSAVKITETWNVWQVDEGGKLVVGEKSKAEPAQPEASSSVVPGPSNKDVAEEPVDPKKTPTPPTVAEKEPEVAPSSPEPKDKLATALADVPVSKSEETKAPLDEEATHADSFASTRPSIVAEPAMRTAEHELQTELSTTKLEPALPTDPIVQTEPEIATKDEVLPKEDVVGNLDEPDPALKTPEAKLEEAAEHLAASADGKRLASGDVETTL